MLFHLIWSGKFFLTDITWKDLAGRALVIQKGVPLEAVFVFEVLTDLHPFTFHTPVVQFFGSKIGAFWLFWPVLDSL